MGYCYYYKGKKYTDDQIRFLMNNSNLIDRKEIEAAVTAQNLYISKKRMEKETDENKKCIMRDMINTGNYDFDLIFGEDPEFKYIPEKKTLLEKLFT